ncbi:MAG: TIGR02452 family protein, partial [Paludibacteraceae bacterium]|nr:TIGR02452 family protein [Paludibacteraceae bacterium]
CKIRTILRLGLRHGNDSLVLGALGCGAFHNPPEQVAELFKQVLNEAEFKNKYRRIIFAVIDDFNAHQAHNPNGNFKPFKEVFATNI